MATIKAYTDLSQSKTLSKILPLESADMVIWGRDLDSVAATDAQKFMSGLEDRKMKYLPCWSLVALLGVLPNPSLHKVYTGWRCDTYNENCTQCQLGNTADTPVDACYEMVLQLHELKML